MDILFVDDEGGLLDQAKIFLEKINDDIEIDTALSAEKGLKKIEEKNYDGIISDYQMPKIDGLEFLKVIREERDMDIPFIMFTGKGREEVAMEALNLGANRYLQKGGDPKSQYGILADAVKQEVTLYYGEKAKERLSSIIDSSQNAIIGKDLQGKILSWNKGAEEIYGYESDEAVGKHISMIAPESKKNEIDDILERIKRGERIEPFETKRITKEGEEIYISLTVSPISNKKGGVIGASVIAQDMTKKKQLEYELKRSEKRFRKAVEKAPYPAMIHAEDGDVISVNKVWTEITGYKKEEIPTVEDWLKKAYGENFERIRRDMEGLYDISDRKDEGIYEVTTKEGEKRYWSFNSSNIGELKDGRSLVLSMADDITERKMEKERLSRTQEVAKVGTWEINLDSGILNWSDESYRIFGIPTGEQMDYDRFLELIHPEDRDRVDEKWKEGLESGEYDVEHRIMVDGRTKWVREKADIQYDEEGEPVEVIGSVQDITERKETEENLRKSEMKYKAITEKSHDTIFILGEEELLFVNKKATELTGYSKEELYQMDYWELIHPDDRKKVRKIDSKGRKGEDVHTRYRARIKTKDGDIKHGDFRVTPIEYKGRSAILGTIRDVTELKDAEEDLDEMEKRKENLVEGIKRYRNLIEASPDTILLINAETGEIVDGNQRAEDLFKMPREDVIGKNISELRPDEEEEIYKKVFRKWKIGTMDAGKKELHILDSEGNTTPVEIGTSYLELGGKKVVFGIFRDITRRKKAEERQEFLHSLLRHDVRNKASIVRGYLELIMQEDIELPDTVQNYLSMAEDGVKESLEIINKVSSLRKAQEENVREVRIDEVVKEVLDHTRDMAGDKGMDITCEFSENGEEVIGGSLLDQVFTNIIENSIQHSGSSRIKIHCSSTEKNIVYIIEDDGRGIPDEEKSKIFQKGYTTDEERGTGLGMFLVKKLLEIYGGDIELKDSDLGGARFDVILKKAE